MHLRRFIAAIGFLIWIGCVVAGFAMLQNYAATAGAAHAPREEAIAQLVSHRRANHGLIVMAVHPECPCTEASLGELGDLLARSMGRCDAVILEYRPATPPATWPKSPATRELGGVNVSVRSDVGGKIAAALGAQTSGHAVFIDPSGTARFHGGITLARGHRGRAPAQDAILAALRGNEMPLAAAPVFGCALEPECKSDATQ